MQEKPVARTQRWLPRSLRRRLIRSRCRTAPESAPRGGSRAAARSHEPDIPSPGVLDGIQVAVGSLVGTRRDSAPKAFQKFAVEGKSRAKSRFTSA